MLPEHHGSPDGYLPSPFVLGAAIAARTKRIRLIHAASLLPLLNPIPVAEDAATLDLISSGRLTLGVGLGYIPTEFAMFGVAMDDRVRRLEDGISVLRQAFTGEEYVADQQTRRGNSRCSADRCVAGAVAEALYRRHEIQADAAVPERGRVVHTSAGRRGDSAVATLFIQPHVVFRDGRRELLDDVLGMGFSILSWGNSPSRILSKESAAEWLALGAKFVAALPMSQLHWWVDDDPNVTVVGDADGKVRAWFDAHTDSVLFLRPDRCVAGACTAEKASALADRIVDTLALRSQLAVPTG